jgi:glycosyltransferase involved in cell wall biosynthesis
MLDPWFKRTYPLKHLKKWIYWPWGEYRVLRDAARVLFTCEEERRLARESFSNFYRAREAVVGLGLRDPASGAGTMRDEFFRRQPELAGKRIVLYLGRLHPKKGLEMLLPAFGKWCGAEGNLRLVIAGSVAGPGVGPEYLDVLKRCAEKSCPPQSVHFCGLLLGDEKRELLAASEVFVLPSHQENFGMAVAEALSFSVPVLITNKVNVWREIEDDGAGLVEPDTGDGIGRLLQRWLTLPEEEKIQMRKLARTCFEQRFDVRKVGATLVKILADDVARAA